MQTKSWWVTALSFLAALALAITPAHAQKTKSALTTEINSQFPDQSSGGITPQIMRTVTTDLVNSLQQYAGVNPQAGTTYTVVLADYGQLVLFSNAGAVAVALPQAAGSFATFNVTVSYTGSGTLTITPTGGSTINGAATLTLAQNQSTWIVSDGTNWQVAKGAAAIPNPLTLALGGTNAALTASNGGIVYSTASALAILSGTATANQIVMSGSSAAPAWSTATYPPTTTINQLLYSSAANVIGGLATVNGGILNANASGVPALTITPLLGTSGGGLTSLGFSNATSGSITVQPTTGALGSSVLTMPAATDTFAVLAAAQALTNKTYNGLTLTSTTGTFTLTNAKTLAVQNSLTLAGTDGKSLTLTNGLTVSGNDGTLSFGAASKTLAVNNTITLAGTDATTWTGPSTNATLAALNIADQTLTGGANVTSQSQSTGNITVDCGSRPLQFITNGGAFTITAPASDGSCVLLVTNNGTAGAITFSGFLVGSNTGDALTTTNTSKFMIFVYRVNASSTYAIKALQ